MIVIQRETGLRSYKEAGIQLKAEISAPLVVSIFNPESPMHDGAIILQNTLIEAAGCILPLTESQMVLPDMGTRHRAALGITEESDAIVIIISEERGTISTAENGRFTNLDLDEIFYTHFGPRNSAGVFQKIHNEFLSWMEIIEDGINSLA